MAINYYIAVAVAAIQPATYEYIAQVFNLSIVTVAHPPNPPIQKRINFVLFHDVRIPAWLFLQYLFHR